MNPNLIAGCLVFMVSSKLIGSAHPKVSSLHIKLIKLVYVSIGGLPKYL